MSDDVGVMVEDCTDRRRDEARLQDIQESVHEIRADMRGLERRLDKTDLRISDIERETIETQAAQKALEAVMNAEHRRLTDKVELVQGAITDLTSRLTKHMSEVSNDQKQTFRVVVGILFTIVGTLAWWAFQRITP